MFKLLVSDLCLYPANRLDAGGGRGSDAGVFLPNPAAGLACQRTAAGGKFRSFLLACVKNLLSNERDKMLAQRRGGGRSPIPLERDDAETRYVVEPPDPMTPEVVFERRWVFDLLERTVEALRQEYAQTNRLDWFEELQGFLPGGKDVASRAEIAQKRGVSVNAIDVAIHRLRQRFGGLLRQKVAETVSSEAEVDEEIRHLMSVLSQ